MQERLNICCNLLWQKGLQLGKKLDLTGKKFGNLLVIQKTSNPKSKSKATFWLCKCSCGEESIVSTNSLTSGKATQCWECAHKESGKKKRVDLSGLRYGRLVVTKMLYPSETDCKSNRTHCECQCDCGNTIIKTADSLQSGATLSCGCLRRTQIQKTFGRDIDGQRFGRLLVLETLWNESPIMVRCKCDCGVEKLYKKSDIQSGHTLSCGCLQKERTSVCNTKDWNGYISKYGIQALRPCGQNSKGQWVWWFKCNCGKEFKCLPAKVQSGHTTSCGCRKESSKERMICKILDNHNVNYIPQISFDKCVYKYRLKFDFGILNNDKSVITLIEYDGIQHYAPIEYFGGTKAFNEQLKRDKIKNSFCMERHIPLLRLPYFLADEEIEQQILSILNDCGAMVVTQ